ncbi:hypothetical protein BH18ACT1_BH18ACT1_06210 [soil metagenome]
MTAPPQRPLRHLPVVVAVGVLGQERGRQEAAPHGATVLADHEVSPLGRGGRLWPVQSQDSLAMAVVLRPPLAAAAADLVWLVAGVAVFKATAAVGAPRLATWWPDRVVMAASGAPVAELRVDLLPHGDRLGAAVVSVRIDLRPLGVAPPGRAALASRIAVGLDERSLSPADDVAAAYSRCSALLGSRLRVALVPTGEARGIAARVDRRGRLELQSATGMVERLEVDSVRDARVI